MSATGSAVVPSSTGEVELELASLVEVVLPPDVGVAIVVSAADVDASVVIPAAEVVACVVVPADDVVPASPGSSLPAPE